VKSVAWSFCSLRGYIPLRVVCNGWPDLSPFPPNRRGRRLFPLLWPFLGQRRSRWPIFWTTVAPLACNQTSGGLLEAECRGGAQLVCLVAVRGRACGILVVGLACRWMRPRPLDACGRRRQLAPGDHRNATHQAGLSARRLVRSSRRLQIPGTDQLVLAPRVRDRVGAQRGHTRTDLTRRLPFASSAQTPSTPHPEPGRVHPDPAPGPSACPTMGQKPRSRHGEDAAPKWATASP
jgi:hypothetical protein